MSRILAIDIGTKRIGLAISDPLNITAQGLSTIKHENKQKTFNYIKSLIKRYDIGKIIVGAPFNMNGTKGLAVKKSEELVRQLKDEVLPDVEMVDERLSTLQGERALLEANISRKKRKLYIDKLSAQIILQSYLDAR